MAERRLYINKKENEVLNRYLELTLGDIEQRMIVCQNTAEMQEWRRLYNDKTTIIEFLRRLKDVKK